MWANRNGFFYVLDRATGKFLLGKPFVKVNWASGLDEKRPADPDAAAGRAADLAGQSGRHQLVSAVVQPAHRAVLLLRRGKTTRPIFGGEPVDVSAQGRNFGGGVNRSVAPVPGAPAMPASAPRPDQQLDRSGRQRRGDRDRSADRRAEVEVHA